MYQIFELDEYVEDGVYCTEPSPNDIKAFEYHTEKRKNNGKALPESMSRITSLRIDWYDNGLTCGEFVVHQIVTVYRNKNLITYRGFNAICNQPLESFDIPIDKTQCEELFSLLERAEAEKDFEQDFIVHVCDGSVWDMKLRHSNNSIKLIRGTVEYPTHGEKIEKYIRAAIDQAFILEEPMIFGCGVYDEE